MHIHVENLKLQSMSKITEKTLGLVALKLVSIIRLNEKEVHCKRSSHNYFMVSK